MKSIALVLLLAAVPSDIGETHQAMVVTEVPVATMVDCTDFTIKGAVHKRVGDVHHFGIMLECKDNGVPL